MVEVELVEIAQVVATICNDGSGDAADTDGVRCHFRPVAKHLHISSTTPPAKNFLFLPGLK